MVDWRLVRHAGARYTVGYGGATALLVALTGQTLFLLGLVALGFVLLLFVAGGTGTVRMGTAMANAESLGIAGTVSDPIADDAFAKTMDADLKLLFYAVGLILFGFAGMIVLGAVA